MLLGAAALAAGCGTAERPQRWHDGRLYLATGNTTGVYYQLGGGYADIISRYYPGYTAWAEPTSASGENIRRIATGDMEIAFSSADTAADAVAGKDSFDGQPQPIRALARIYRNYTHAIVTAGSGITSVAGMRGKRISTGSRNSGTDAQAGRLLAAAGLDPEKDVTRLRLSLPDTAKGMRAGTIDGLFWSGGLPTPGIADLVSSAPAGYRFLPLADLLGPLSDGYGPVYVAAELPAEAYSTGTAVPTIAVANLLLVGADMPDTVAGELTRLLYDHQAELAGVHPEGKNFDRITGELTLPVPLHPGARAYYRAT